MAYRPAREGNLLSLYINNRAGGLIFHRVRSSRRSAHLHRSQQHPPPKQDFSPNAAKLDTNEQMQLASTFSGLALIMGQLAPSRPSSGMQLLEADGGRTSTAGHPRRSAPTPRCAATGFLLQSFDSPTGIKFFLTAEPDAKGLDLVLREVRCECLRERARTPAERARARRCTLTMLTTC